MLIPESLAAYPQFVLWISKPSRTRPGKTDKFPIDPRTGAIADAHDPANQLTAAEAQRLHAGGLGEGVGFVFTDRDPFFFLDIDNALQPSGQWSPLAQDLCGAFAGCFIEVSHSGTGLHVIGTGAPGEHGSRSSEHGLELYHRARYVALTFTHASGDPAVAAQPALEWLVDQFFPPSDAMVNPAEWTDRPAEEWNGPADDDALIDKMLASKPGAGAAFGNRATLCGLWEANSDELGRAYPDPRGFDHSSADAALCQHLAFWTGRDCERMDRLFRRSGLYREKWERPDYMQRTILHAVGHCSQVYGARAAKPAQVTADGLRDGFQFLAVTQQVDHFAGCVYIRSLHAAYCPDGSILEPQQFRVTYGGYVFALDLIADKVTKNAWEAFTESQGFCFPKVNLPCFRPEVPPGAIITEEGQTMCNTYLPIPTVSQHGDVSRFLDHSARVLPDQRDRDILFAYMAALVQYPGEKFQWMPLLQGIEGNGKTVFSRCLEFAVGKRYTHWPNARDISNKFNAWLVGKIFIGIEELYVADRQEALDALKPLITNDRVEIQGKGANQETGDNRANFLATTNHRDAVRKTHGDRRYCVFFTAQQEPGDLERDGMGGNYFPGLYDWLRGGGYAAVNHFFRSYAIPDELNPAKGCHRAPETSTTPDAIVASLGGLEQEVLELIEQGRPGFAGGWVSSLALDRLIDEKRIRMNFNKRRELLRGLGYDYHPALTDGRVNNAFQDVGAGLVGKPRLYIKAGHLAAQLVSAAEVARHYQEAQAGVTTAGQAFATEGQGKIV